MDRLLLRASFPVHRKQQFLWTGFLSRPSFFLDSFFHTEAIEEAKERKKERKREDFRLASNFRLIIEITGVDNIFQYDRSGD